MDVEPKRPPDSTPLRGASGAMSGPMSTYDRVVDLLNKASIAPQQEEKVKCLRIVMELIVHKEPNLLDNFIDEMLGFQTDRSVDVRKFVVVFIEEASKKDPDILPRIIGNLTMMLQDDSVQVAKKVILCMGQIYKIAFEWVAKAKTVNFEMKQTWQYIQQLRSKIGDMLEVNNEGVRFYSVKFLECIITTLTRSSKNTELPKGMKHDVALEVVPEGHSLMKIKKLEEDGKQAFDTLITYMNTQSISSTNLMTCMGSLTAIAKMRPTYLSRVLQNFEILHLNLPTHFTPSQVSSVRKNLKMQLLSLLKHPAALEIQSDITTLLTDLGATQSEVMKALPKEDRKRKSTVKPDGGQAQKKTKIQPGDTPLRDDEEDYMVTPFTSLGAEKKPRVKPAVKKMSEEQRQLSAIHITTEDLIPRLSVQNVADLVLLSMVVLPDTMPAQFQSTYTPIAAAGTDAQIKHLAKLLATQLTTAGLGKGVEEVKQGTLEEDEDDDVPVDATPKHTISVVGATVKDDDDTESIAPAMPPPAAIPISRRPGTSMRAFKLESITQPLRQTDMDRQALHAFKRILKLEKQAHLGLMAPARVKILVTLVTQFGGSLRDELEAYIFEDLRTREDIAVAWIYQEFANAQGYNLTSMQLGPLQDKLSMNNYDETLSRLLRGVLQRPDHREGLFSRLILESPTITTNAIQILKNYCQDETRILLGMTTLKELILKRPVMKLEFLDVLLDFTSHEKPDVRNTAIRVTKKLHETTDLRDPIERYALYYLKLLLQPSPPGELFGPGKGREEPTNNWNEDTIKLCLYLYLGLLPVNHKLIHELAKVYTAAASEIKRTILRVLENPVKGMGMQSPELISLVDTCPKGAETLITRVIHILTENAPPSPELVERVRDLYHKRVDDVRFLIPVLTGLSKKEVISALPQLIKLNPVVVKEVFNRLLGAQGSGHESHQVPLTPAELLIALHNIDPNKCDMKTVIKATNLCFAEKEIYTQEVLLMVMQELTEQTPLPTLLMRTVLQSLVMWPKVIGLVLNILQRLVQKHVWKQKKVWEGFVKCCQRTKPHCFNVLLQLAPPQLKSAFEIAPDLRPPLLKHVQSFTPHQQAHIPKAVMLILEKDPAAEAQKEQERLAVQEKIYQQKLEEERKRQQEKLKITIPQEKVEKAKEQLKSPVPEEPSSEVKTETAS